MAFRLADVKKTVRSRSDGDRYLHPRLLDGPAPATQIALALGYFQARLGHARREFDPEMLVRFFGDPTVARGLVACLNQTFRWQAQTFAEVLDPPSDAWLRDLGIDTPSDLRVHLFDAVNRSGDGYLARERDQHLVPLARRLHISVGKLDQLFALDAEENAVLVRAGDLPEPHQVLRQYNFSVVDALLRNSRSLAVVGLDADARGALVDACLRFGVPTNCEGAAVSMGGKQDAFGSFARWGVRLARALYTAAALHPEVLASGSARVALPGRQATYLLDRKARHALTGGAGVVRCGGGIDGLREAWQRHRGSRGTAGWRLSAIPEPIMSDAGLLLPPAICRRGASTVLLWPVATAASLADLIAINRTGIDVLAVVADAAEGSLPSGIASASGSGGVPALLGALNSGWQGTYPDAAGQVLEGVLEELAHAGFIAEVRLAEALGCTVPEDLPARLRLLDGARATYIPGTGLCSPDFAEAMRRGLRKKRQRTPAA